MNILNVKDTRIQDYLKTKVMEKDMDCMVEVLTNSIMDMLDILTDDERLEIFYRYCVHCGSKDVKCQCWNDE